MLTLYGSEDIKVPGVEYVKIFRDDRVGNEFYMMTEHATIARDEQGKPLFTFIMYARDVDKLAPDDLQVEKGYIALSTQAAVSPEDEQKIRNYLRNLIGGEPVLSYPPIFLDGKVEFASFSDSNDAHAVVQGTPSLMGANIASFSRNLSQNDAEVFRQAVVKGKLPAIVNYDLTYVASIPAITVHIHGDSGAFYREVVNYIRIYGYGAFFASRYYMYSISIASIQQFRSNFHSLTIDIDNKDFRDESAGGDLTKKLEDMAFDILKNNVLPALFQDTQPPSGTDAASLQQWLDALQRLPAQTIDLTFSSSAVVKMPVHPTAQLAEVLTPSEIGANTIYLDLSHTFFEELAVSVNANINFKDDPVFEAKVFLEYDQFDELRDQEVKSSKELAFKSSDTVETFRLIKAKDKNGVPKDTYHYWSEIIYKDTGDTIRVPQSGMLDSVEPLLTISYHRLGFIKVNIVLEEIPDSIGSAIVRMSYPGSTAASAQQTFELTKAKPTASFFTYTGQISDTQQYTYQVTYMLSNGQRMDMPVKTGQSETLLIPNPFNQNITTRFMAQGDFSQIARVIVDAVYNDPNNNYSQTFHGELTDNGQTATWTFGLRDPEKLDMQYTVTIAMRNGSQQQKPAVTHRLGETIPVGPSVADVLPVTVTVSNVDWSKYSTVLVYLEYKDVPDAIDQQTHFIFRQANSSQDQTWSISLQNPQLRTYSYRMRYVGVKSSDNLDVDWTSTSDPIVVVQNP